MVYDRDLKEGRGLLRVVGHSDLALDAEGREVLVYQDIDTDQVSMLDLADGTVTPLVPIDFSHTALGLHFSGRAYDRPGWVLVSTHSVHNLAFGGFAHEHDFGAVARRVDYIQPAATFQGIVRADGRIATRNYLGVIASVNCSAGVARLIADHFRGRLADYPNVDGVVALTHTTGCGMAIAGEGMDMLRRTLTGHVRHPNFYAVLVVDLGCEVNQVDAWFNCAGLEPGESLHALDIQREGGTAATVKAGIARIEALLPAANAVERRTVSAEYLVVGLECGGSDGYFGISANPALGAAADLLVRHGGTAILSETPEIYGAEHLLTRRAVSREVGENLLARIRWWEEYAVGNRAEIDNNPSPGNKAGGLTTILEKSLGAAAKGGTTNLEQVYEYAEPVVARGLVFMDTPGYDTVSVTGQVAGGANLVCFTTGRGSVAGCVPSPMIKLATNSRLYRHMEGDMDVDCGAIVDGAETVEQAGERIFRLMLETAYARLTAGTPRRRVGGMFQKSTLRARRHRRPNRSGARPSHRERRSCPRDAPPRSSPASSERPASASRRS